MNYLSVCSGIEAATVAWHHMGWKPVGFSEVEPFPCAVLAHHYPQVKNFGDMTKFKEWNLHEPVNVLVGGTPCQSFSVAGLRQGLKDPRGNLMLTYLAIAERFRPRWLVWENVPGVLSSNRGRDFGTFLGALVNLGYGFAYRVLDAQWFGVAQRRRRVFVVGHIGNAECAAKVLFESESVCRNTAPSRENREGVATNVAPSLTASNDPSRSPQSSEITQQVNAILKAQVVGTLCSDSHPGSYSGQDAYTGRLIATAFHPTQDLISNNGISHALGTGSKSGSSTAAVCFESNRRDGARVYGDTTNTLQAFAGTGGGNSPMVQQSTAVRRLTPTECERLQGFPDGYTAIAWKKKPASECPDGPRYKALGNSMAVPVMRWIGERIKKINN